MRHEIVIDRLEVEFCLVSPSQQRHVRNRLGGAVTFVTALDHNSVPYPSGKENASTTRFRALIQDPASAKAVLTAIQACGGLAGFPKLVMLEVALDTYIPGAETHQLAHVVADLYRGLEAEPAKDWHCYRRSGEGNPTIEAVADRRSLVSRLAGGWNLADTPDKGSPIRYHAYVKTHDDGDRELPREQWRARFEVTLRGNALPTDDMHTLESLNLNNLTEHFRFRKLADGLHPAARHGLENFSVRQLGLKGSYKRKHPTKVGMHSGQRTKFRTSTRADTPLNESVRMELRRLDRAWRSKDATPRRKPIDKNFRAALPPQLSPAQEDAYEDIRATLDKASDVSAAAISSSTPGDRVLWEWGGPSHKRAAPNYVYTQHLEVNADGSTTLSTHREVSTSSAQEPRCSSQSVEETTCTDEAEPLDRDEDQ